MSGAARMRALTVLGRAVVVGQAEFQSARGVVFALARTCSSSSSAPPPSNISGLTPHANKFARERHRDMQRRLNESASSNEVEGNDIPEEDFKSSSSIRRYDTSGGHLDFHNALDVKNPSLSSPSGQVDSGIDSGAAMEREGTPGAAPINATDRWSMQDRLNTSRNKNDIGQCAQAMILRVPRRDKRHLWMSPALNKEMLRLQTATTWSQPVRMLLHTTPSHPSPPADGSAPELTRRQRLQLAVRDYGSTVMVFHITISLASLGAFYTAVSSGLDVVGLLSAVPYVGEKLASTGELGSGATTFVVAYAVHKAFAPVRISVTLACAPLIVRYLRRKGILKVKK